MVAIEAGDVAELLAQLDSLGIQVWLAGDDLRYRAPKGLMTPERLALLRSRRAEIVAALRTPAVAVRPDPAGRYQPFPLTDVQAAYLVGRGSSYPYGGVGCHGYGELRFDDLDPGRLEAAWSALVRRHDMLRAQVSADGSQRVRPDPPPGRIACQDLRGATEDEVAAAVARTRAELDHRVYAPGDWPLYDLRVTRFDQGAIVHLSIDFLIADFVSLQVLLRELESAYHDPATVADDVGVTFRDIVLAGRNRGTELARARDRDYWWERLPELPEPPELPLRPAPDGDPRFRRLAARLPSPQWAALARRAAHRGVTASSAVLGAYAEVVGRWSRQQRFTLNVTVLRRPPVHPRVGQVVGDFTAVELLAVDTTPSASYAERVQALQARLWEDLDHPHWTGIDVIRELRRRAPDRAMLFPVVFTSSVGLAERDGAGASGFDRLVHGISQTPQVWLDCQVMEGRDGLVVNWDYREAVFPDGVVPAMFAAFTGLLRELAEGDAAWEAASPVPVPAAQLDHRPARTPPVGEALLPGRFLALAERDPDRVAVLAGGVGLSYGELAGRAAAVAELLAGQGCPPGTLVAVEMEKGWEQVVAVLGVLLAGGAYLPLDTSQPRARRERILTDAGVGVVLTQSRLAGEADHAGTTVVAVDTLPVGELRRPPAGRPDSLAYVIYTSGSTGTPKGVMISHRAAWNTVADINQTFHIGPDDRVLGLASLGFDLSVYDIFGPLSAGGCLVLPDAGRRAEPGHWAELIDRHQVTVWNSVPAQMEMLLAYLRTGAATRPGSLRLALLSGDWIPVTLPAAAGAAMPGLRLVSLGGATEAAIWSIAHPIETVAPDAPSIPYGRPLSGQTVEVLDASLRPVPDLVAGELYIGGAGLAEGYLGDDAKTAERFIRHPVDGERRYRTGDLGRYLPDGSIEFLGREDSQVKIRGHRVELAEVEAALVGHPAVAAAAVITEGERPGPLQLAAFVEPAPVEPDAGHPDLAARAVAEAAELRAGVDDEGMLAFARQLDSTALLQMLGALHERGLFGGGEDAHSVQEVLERARVAPAHHRLVRRWLRALRDNELLRQDPDGRFRLAAPIDPDAAAHAWRRIEQAVPAVEQRRELIEYFQTTARHLPELLRGELDPLGLLFPEGRTEIHEVAYNAMFLSRYLNKLLVSMACRLAREWTGPGGFRVLEVGAGVGGTSAELIPALAGLDVEYLFTDVSEFFLHRARTRYRDYPWVGYQRFDLNADFRRQGLLPNRQALIVCANVLHYARDVEEAVARLRELLTPGGWLLFIEATKDSYQIMTSMEFLFDEGLGDFEDVRRHEEQTFVTRRQWRDVLDAAGAESVVCLPEDDPITDQMGMHVFAARFKAGRARISSEGLRSHLADQLPEHMVPAHVQVVDRLPLSGNGKLDRRTLRSWLPPRTGEPASTGAPPAGDLEQRLAAIWARLLRLERVGRDQDFFELGGDSLLAAQLATELGEGVPEAAGIFFDHLLRLVLEHPTIAALAGRLAAPQPPAPEPAPAAVARERSSLVQLGAGPGDPVVVFHDAAGGLAAYRQLRDLLADTAPLVGVRVDDVASYQELPAGELVDRVAGRYAAELIAAGHRRLKLAGVRFGGLLAAETARHLVEAGVRVERLVVVGAGGPAWPVGEELAGEGPAREELAGEGPVGEADLRLEYLFLREAGVDAVLPDRPLDGLPLARILDAMRAESRAARFARLGELPAGASAATSMIDGFRTFRHSLRGAAAHDLLPYAGDVTLLCPAPSELWPAAPAEVAAYWREVCLGELEVRDVAGDYVTCGRAGAAELAGLLAGAAARSR